MSQLMAKKKFPVKDLFPKALDTTFPPKIATQYDYESQSNPGTIFDDGDPNSQSLTDQSDTSTNITEMMKRYEKSGLVTDLLTGNLRSPMYGDFSEVGDFLTIKNKVARAQQIFDAYPASIRNKFKNDPAMMIEYLADPKNDEEAISLGLKPAQKEPVAESSKLNPEKDLKKDTKKDPKKDPKKSANADGDPGDGDS